MTIISDRASVAASSHTLVAFVDMRADLVANSCVIVVEPGQLIAAQHVQVDQATIDRRRVSVSKAFTGFSAPAMSVPTTSSRFSIRMP